ncbi:hypothetical protein [Iodidimonas sp. SYSU 1G8]
MPFKSIGLILLAGFMLGFWAVPLAQSLDDETLDDNLLTASVMLRD